MNEKNNYYLLIPIVILLLVLAFSWLRRETVYDNGNGINAVRIQLEQAGANQHKFTERVGNIEEKLNSCAERVERIESGEREAGAIIAECQSILRTVRQRGAQNKSTP